MKKLKELRRKYPAKMLSLTAIIIALMVCIFAAGCSDPSATTADRTKQKEIANELALAQPTPTDISYSLERYNLIKRAYWVNGQRERAMSYPCEILKPMGYIVLITDNGTILGRFEVDGKVTSLRSYLTPDSDYYEKNGSSSGGSYPNEWLADVDGSYGDNDNGIFFFTVDGKYVEYTGDYLYSDVPFVVNDPVLKIEGGQ